MHDKAILVVGSDIRLCAEIRNCLRRIGLHAVVLAIADEVPDRLAQLRFDAAVLEIDTHDDHYDESVLSIRRSDPQCRIIAVSDAVNDAVAAPIERNLRVLGVRQIIQRPVGVNRLHQAVLAVLGGRNTPISATQATPTTPI